MFKNLKSKKITRLKDLKFQSQTRSLKSLNKKKKYISLNLKSIFLNKKLLNKLKSNNQNLNRTKKFYLVKKWVKIKNNLLVNSKKKWKMSHQKHNKKKQKKKVVLHQHISKFLGRIKIKMLVSIKNLNKYMWNKGNKEVQLRIHQIRLLFILKEML